MTTFAIRQIATGKTTQIRAAGFAQALAKFVSFRRAEIDAEHKGVKAVNTIRAELQADGGYDCNGTRFAILAKFYVPTVAPDRVAIMDTRGEEAMRRGYGHY